MKNKKFLIAIALLVIVSIGVGTYAIYKSTASGTGTIGVAKWNVKIGPDGSVGNSLDGNKKEFEITGSQINWVENTKVASGKVAPGKVGYVDFVVDATGTEVDVHYTITPSGLSTLPEGSIISLLATDDLVNSYENSAAVSSFDGYFLVADTNKTKTVRVYIIWEAVDDDDVNVTDTSIGKTIENLTFTVDFTVQQDI